MHDVTVLTRESHRSSIESCSQSLPAGLRFAYFDSPARAQQLAHLPFYRQAFPYAYYRAWQHDVLPFARELHREKEFDLAQHITWGAWRQPSHLHRLGIPLVFGPLGGGDSTPPQLRATLGLRGRFQERLRDIGNWGHLLFPSLWECFDRALLIVCRTEGTRDCIPRRYWPKVRIHREIGVNPERIASTPPTRTSGQPLRLLYVGRFLRLKGIHLALKSLGQFLRRNPGAATFDLIGGRGDDGYLQELQALIASEGIQDNVRIHGWMPHDQVQNLYRRYDIFFFPSFRDSGGTAVLESLAAGLPVICLDLGGPPKMLGGKGGMVVEARDQSERQIVDGMTNALETLHASPERVASLKQDALIRAHEMTWESTVQSVYQSVEVAMR